MNFRFNREVTKKTTVILFLILMAGLLIYWIGYFVTDSFFETGGVMREDQWQEAAGDYFFPAWGISLYLAVFFAVILFWNSLKMKKYS